MADYASPTVVQPTIPNADMTALERLLLTHIFESEPDGDGLYFFAETSPNDQIELPIKALRAALASVEGGASETAAFVQGQLKDLGDDEPYVQMDLSMTSYEFILQEIVKRSSTLNHIAIVTSFTCTMRSDGFGGMAVLVTADAIKGKSTQDIIGDFQGEAEHGPLAAAPGFGVHVLLRLHEQQVRQMIPRVIETDEALTPIAACAVTDDDIRAACAKVAERIELNEEGDSAVFKAALAAIREAEQRLAPVR